MDKLQIERRAVDLRDLVPCEKNAHYMPPHTYQRLVENLRRDGVLTSTPLVYRRDDDKLEIVSGHHRVKAAIEAGIVEAEVLVIVTKLSKQRLVALQLAHNSINGDDDKSILAQLYAALDLDTKKYSGLDDSVLSDLGKLSAGALNAFAIKYEEIVISFLSEDHAAINEYFARIKNRLEKRQFFAAKLEDYERFFDVLVNVKHQMNVMNNGLTFVVMAELAMERLEQIEAEEQEAKKGG